MNTSGSAGLISGMTSSFMNDVIGLFVGLDRVNVLGMFFFNLIFPGLFLFCVRRTDERTGWIRIADRPAMDVTDCQNGSTRFRFYR